MLHLALAGNLMTSIESGPQLYSDETVPTYGGPDDVILKSGIPLRLEPCEKDNLECFLKVTCLFSWRGHVSNHSVHVRSKPLTWRRQDSQQKKRALMLPMLIYIGLICLRPRSTTASESYIPSSRTVSLRLPFANHDQAMFFK
jgi:hypothetical protein